MQYENLALELPEQPLIARVEQRGELTAAFTRATVAGGKDILIVLPQMAHTVIVVADELAVSSFQPSFTAINLALSQIGVTTLSLIAEWMAEQIF